MSLNWSLGECNGWGRLPPGPDGSCLCNSDANMELDVTTNTCKCSAGTQV